MGDRGNDTRTSFSTLVVERRGAAGVVRLNRPDRLNAIGRQTVQDLRDACELLSADPTVAAVVFTGEGRAFSAGADISEISALDGPQEFLGFIREIQRARTTSSTSWPSPPSPRSTGSPSAAAASWPSPATCASWPLVPPSARPR